MGGPGKLLREKTQGFGESKIMKQQPVFLGQDLQKRAQRQSFMFSNSDQKMPNSERSQTGVLDEHISPKKKINIMHSDQKERFTRYDLISPVKMETFSEIQTKINSFSSSKDGENQNQKQNVKRVDERKRSILEIDFDQVKQVSIGVISQIRNFVKSKTRGDTQNDKTVILDSFNIKNVKRNLEYNSIQNHKQIPSIRVVDDTQSLNSDQHSEENHKNLNVIYQAKSLPISGRPSLLETMKSKLHQLIDNASQTFENASQNQESSGRFREHEHDYSKDFGSERNPFGEVQDSKFLQAEKQSHQSMFSPNILFKQNTIQKNKSIGCIESIDTFSGSHTQKYSQQISPNKRRKQAYTDNFTNATEKTIFQQHGETIAKSYSHLLTPFERQEILKYSEVYYIGSIESKEQRKFKSILRTSENNNGFDRSGGFYKVVVGDHVAYRYQVIQELDHGAFGQVLRCIDHKTQREVAVKINKNMASHHNTCRAEASIMQRLRDTVPDDEEYLTSLNVYKEKIIKYFDHFLFRNHYCFVYELLGKNLYQEMKENQFKGHEIKSKVRPLSYQIVQGLIYLKHCQVIHCDLKPENILYADSRRKDLKIIDFGSSSSLGMNTFTYVQSRFYRAPEVVLGIPYDHQVDMWSLGVIIAELYCGRPIFPGLDENELLEFQVLMCGNPPQYMIDKCKKKDQFFNVNQGYRIIRSPNSRLLNLSKNSASLYSALFNDRFPENMKNQEINERLTKEERLMVDFIKKCLQIDPAQRITCDEAIRHEWFKELLIQTDQEIDQRNQEIMNERELQLVLHEDSGNKSPDYIHYDQSPNYFEPQIKEFIVSPMGSQEVTRRNSSQMKKNIAHTFQDVQKLGDEQQFGSSNGTPVQREMKFLYQQRIGSTITTQASSSGGASKNIY